MQWGSAWWFLDQLDGMEAQIRMLANMALLSRFVGMITDSRSLLSYSRHDSSGACSATSSARTCGADGCPTTGRRSPTWSQT